MSRNEIEQVLANWIAEAISPLGQLPKGIDQANWIAQQFLNWWRSQVENAIGDASRAVAGIKSELNRLGGWGNDQLGEALHEVIHAEDALAELQASLGLAKDAEQDV